MAISSHAPWVSTWLPAGWKPTVDSYLGRVPKARILEAVREAKGEHSAQLIDHLKKAEMAKEAERLLDGTGWLPEPLRLAGAEPAVTEPAGEAEALPDFLTGEDDDDRDADATDPEEPQPHAIAAE
jgi:ParB family transcriptional regulator, chromosome partitioning protein